MTNSFAYKCYIRIIKPQFYNEAIGQSYRIGLFTGTIVISVGMYFTFLVSKSCDRFTS